MFPLEVSEYKDTDARGTGMMFSVEYSPTSAISSIVIKLEEIALLVAQKNKKKECWAKSKSIAFFGMSGLSRIRCTERNRGCLIELSSTNRKCSMDTLVGGSNNVITEKYEFDYRNKPINLNTA